jgi:AcrR family transcriptional regulator
MVESKTGRVIEAAKRVFLQYGYQHVTMGDIASAAGMSRPALYLVYPSKVEIFSAALADVFDAQLAEVRETLERDATLEHKLKSAFDIWCVRPFEMVLASPDAKDLLESGRTFATELVDRQFAAFEGLLAHQLAPLVRAQARVRLPAIQIARLMVGAALGFKQQAKDAPQLRAMIGGQIALVLASLR